ncbi:diguanylate cyclase [Trichocoleus sp. FACHB-90]|uniref:diguanylate cyclase domain-containing protein n=1 Tax=Cyanophyceae TaxID=3028117 RepID=UPI00168336A5|nr:diguanylate cyclase [Trichocoleus sp. FACHB-90]MBD1927234.1 diguanylate cyclase [Trichocoleus sp. FACHB-90]
MNQGQPFKSKANILVVDDTPENITLLTQILSSHGYKVRVSPNGKLALESVRSSPPDLILLDIKMPDMDGYEVCQRLKASKQTCDIPTIFISALDANFDKVTAFMLGGVDYITKPFEYVEVLARIENQLRLRRFQLQLQAQNAQLQLLLTTTQAISEAADVEEALEAILANVCQTIGWDFGEAWIPNEEGTVIEYSRAWYASDVLLNEFRQQSETFGFAVGEGLVGRVWLSQQLEWIADVSRENDRVFRRSRIAAEAGLKGALGIPIAIAKRCECTIGHQVLAVLVFFQRHEMAPDERSLSLVNAVAAQFGSMIQHKKAEAALRQANLKLERLASIDGLTQLANRRRFDDYLSHEWKRATREQQPLSLILFDVDYFKRYNDCYGHQSGDDCLQQLAKAASRAVKRPADLVARYGGEEFAAILPNTSAQGATAVAQAIRLEVQQLKLPHAQSKVSDYVTLSLGVSSAIPTEDCLPETLIAMADEALYQAKNQGRDRIILKTDCSRTSLTNNP